MNNSKNRVLTFLVVFLLLTNIAVLLYFTVFTRPVEKGNHPERRGSGVTAFLQQEVGFTKPQMDALDSLKKQHRAAIRPLFDELGKSKDAFYHLLGAPDTADSVLQAASNDIGRKQAAVDLQFYRNFTSMRKLCTPEQLIKFDSTMPVLASKMMQPWQKNNPDKKKDSTETRK